MDNIKWDDAPSNDITWEAAPNTQNSIKWDG